MAQLAIQGHETRGNEIIKVLESLGGKNSNHCTGEGIYRIYFINSYGHIETTSNLRKFLDYTILTLDEILTRMPYKIGDMVWHDDKLYEITGITWHSYYDKITYNAKGENEKLALFDAEKFRLAMKQEITHIDMPTIRLVEAQGTLISLSDGYELRMYGDGVIVVKKHPQYPKTYKECCDVLGLNTMSNDVNGYKHELLIRFQELLIARDAYWKIAGEQMELGKSWKPDWKDDSDKYFICYIKNELWMSNISDCNRFLVFPTAEMRDEFYENFKGLIEKCKELL